MDQRAIDLYDEYTHTALGRGDFLLRLAKLAGSVAAANAMLPLLDVDYTSMGKISLDDSRMIAEYTTFKGPDGEVKAYIARPDDDKPHPGVVVIHENRGLNAHIEDVARRVATAGYIALAPDALSPLGGTPDDRDEARTMIGKLDREASIQLFLAAAQSLRARPHGTGKVGCVGFCWGGAMANKMAVRDPKLNGAVAFYGRQPSAEEVPQIKASLLLHYAGLDKRVNAGIDGYKAALDANKTDYTMHIYDGVNHAFHNDTAPSRYDEGAAKLAWDRTLKFFNSTLK